VSSIAAMDSAAGSAGPSRRACTFAWAGLAAVLALSLCVSVHPWYDPTNDGSMYIATARALAAGEGYTFLGIPFLIRPPGFACLLAPLVALRGTDFFALNLFVSVWGALGVLGFHFLLRARLGLALATLVPLVLWFNPGYQRLCNQVMSDVPGWTLLVGCLWLARRVRRGPGLRTRLLLGAVIGLASYVRSGNALLVPALLAADVLRELVGKDRRGWRACLAGGAALVLGSVLVLAPWSWRNSVQAPPPPADQTLLYSYGTGMWHTDMGDPRSPRVPLSEVLARFGEQGRKSVHTLGTRLGEGPARPWTPWIAGLLVGALLVAAVRRREPEELLALGTLLVVAFYFGYAGRLLLPVFALALAALVELVRDGGARLAGPRAGAGAAGLLALGALALDWQPRARWDEIEGLHRAYLDTAAQVAPRLTPETRLGAYRGWHHAVYLGRPVYSFEQAVERGGNPAACEAILDKYGLDTVLLTPLGLPEPVQRAERAFAAYVARRYGGPELGVTRVR
jgi:4-amino-4-deoxy-L-arabinose transferase-like glycosyltransferase